MNVHLNLGQSDRASSTHPIDSVGHVALVVSRIEVFAVPAFGEADQADLILVVGTDRWYGRAVLDVVATIP